MTKENIEQLKVIFKDQDFLKKLSEVKSREEFIALLADYNVEATDSDIDNMVNAMEKAINMIEKNEEISNNDELSEDNLDAVSGGAIPPSLIAVGIQVAVPAVVKGVKSLVNLCKKKKKK